MSILDKMIDASFRGNKKETQEERRKRLIEEGKATEQDFQTKSEQSDYEEPTSVDENWVPQAKKKKPGVKK